MLTTVPNLLSLSRIVVIPVLVGIIWYDSPVANWVACILFTAASLTDFLDGYLARTWRQQSKLGRFLDPVADKLLIAATILMLVAAGRISGLTVLPALVILCREILVSGLREFLAELQVGMPVNRLAKWKTTLQMIAIGFLLVGHAGPVWAPIQEIGEIGLWIAAVLTLITGYDYLRTGLEHMTDDETPGRHDHEPKANPAKAHSSPPR
ncbi:MAG: CDP-diacylglycerol--glycerol-3-phosphate 3-phosphatidyltransferase [Alphaproteobacteria bacterium]